jgi:hypothetical protein
MEPENGSGLAEAIARLLKEPDSVERMGQFARRRALDNFSFQRHVDALKPFIGECSRIGARERILRVSPDPKNHFRRD